MMQVTQPHYSPDLTPCDFCLLPKTKISFERVEISVHRRDSGKYNRAADGNWENCVRSQGAYFEGDWGITILCTTSCILFNKCSLFSLHMAGYLLDRPHIKNCYNSKIKRQTMQLKMTKNLDGQFCKGDTQIAKKHMKKMFNIIIHHKNENQNHPEMQLHTH